METTLHIDDAVMRRLRVEAARRGTTASALAEAGIRRLLDAAPQAAAGPDAPPPLPTWNGGAPAIDAADREAIRAALDEDAGSRAP